MTTEDYCSKCEAEIDEVFYGEYGEELCKKCYDRQLDAVIGDVEE